MKKITCELCGNNDLIKMDDVFVCEYCGTKYSLEEANKMIIEGTVNIQGIVKIDESDNIIKYYTLARRTADIERDYSTAKKYFDLLLLQNPNSWEYVFYSKFCYTMLNYTTDFNDAINQLYNSVSTVFRLRLQNVQYFDEDFELDVDDTISRITYNMGELGELIYQSEKNIFYSLSKYTRFSDSESNRFFTKCEMLCKVLEKYNDEVNKLCEFMYTKGRSRTFTSLLDGKEYKDPYIDSIKRISDDIKYDVGKIDMEKFDFDLDEDQKKFDNSMDEIVERIEETKRNISYVNNKRNYSYESSDVSIVITSIVIFLIIVGILFWMYTMGSRM
jgi:hypothetical protein